MANRKQTPDVLGDLLGGEPSVPQPAPGPQPKSQARRKQPARRSPSRSRAKPPKWEYLEVVFRDYGGFRPCRANGEDLKGWKRYPPIHEYLNKLGEEGWELAGVGDTHRGQMTAYLKRLKV